MLRLSFQNEVAEAGCDEAGRGCLAGPVFAAAVILPSDFSDKILNDSKQLTRKQRDKLRPVIEREAIAWAVSEVSHERIDQINILNASFEAMTLAVRKLELKPGLLLIDGNRFRTTLDIPYKCIIGGDGIYANIAAASVLAKTYRDELMEKYANIYPQYGWQKNMGYATREHRLAIAEFGLSDIHRKTFRNSANQLSLF